MKFRWLTLLLSLLLVLSFYKNVNARAEINLARTTLTTVDASSVNGNRELSNRYYGVLNLFDKGENLIDNINYDYWYSDPASEHWVELVFVKPMTITSINVDKAEGVDLTLPSEDKVSINKSGNENTEKYHNAMPIKSQGYKVPFNVQVVTETGLVESYSGKDEKLIFDPALENVIEMKLLFHPKGQNPAAIKVSEIQVFGYPPDMPYKEQKPNIRSRK